ncbi:hypothetical protein [Streptomyces sp. NPDC056983]|uniref:hypothetical protein n=1 Tax=Streptomyces sp. NPDC056983 TaxID=3345987 RepID=UPI00363ED89C
MAQLLGVLTIEQLYVVALAAGVSTVFFDVAYQAYLPQLIDRERLVEGNAKLRRLLDGPGGPGVAYAKLSSVARQEWPPDPSGHPGC